MSTRDSRESLPEIRGNVFQRFEGISSRDSREPRPEIRGNLFQRFEEISSRDSWESLPKIRENLLQRFERISSKLRGNLFLFFKYLEHLTRKSLSIRKGRICNCLHAFVFLFYVCYSTKVSQTVLAHTNPGQKLFHCSSVDASS